MICDNCGKRGATVRKVTRAYGTGQKLRVIEGIPAVRCPHCGETYFTAETLHEIERLRLHGEALSKKRQVAVTTYK